jgi:hypothetical protein
MRGTAPKVQRERNRQQDDRDQDKLFPGHARMVLELRATSGTWRRVGQGGCGEAQRQAGING